MIDRMPRPRPLHLHKEINRHGKTVWYVRIDKGPRIRLRAPFGSDAFNEEYRAAIAGEPLGKLERAKQGTLQWLYDRYRDSGAWADLSKATRRQRENIFKHVLETSGKEPVKDITRRHIVAGKDRRKGTPSQARNFYSRT